MKEGLRKAGEVGAGEGEAVDSHVHLGGEQVAQGNYRQVVTRKVGMGMKVMHMQAIDRLCRSYKAQKKKAGKPSLTNVWVSLASSAS